MHMYVCICTYTHVIKTCIFVVCLCVYMHAQMYNRDHYVYMCMYVLVYGMRDSG